MRQGLTETARTARAVASAAAFEAAHVMGERRTRPLLDLAMGATVLVCSALSLAVVAVTLASP